MDPAVSIQVAIIGLIGGISGGIIAAIGTVLGNTITQIIQGRREKLLSSNREGREDHFRFSKEKREVFARLLVELQSWMRDTKSAIARPSDDPDRWLPIRSWVQGSADDGLPVGDKRNNFDALLAEVSILSFSVHVSAHHAVRRFDWVSRTLAGARPGAFLADMFDKNDRQLLEVLENELSELTSVMTKDLKVMPLDT